MIDKSMKTISETLISLGINFDKLNEVLIN
jgi:hypothetical protein